MPTTWNSADNSGWTLTGSNLIATNATGSNAGVRSLANMTSGKSYWEYTLNSSGSSLGVGVGTATANLSGFFNANASGGCMLWTSATGNIFQNGANSGLSLGANPATATIGLAWDAAAAKLWFRITPSGNWNGQAIGISDPAAGVGGVVLSALGAVPMYALVSSDVANTRQVTANFGGSAFSGAVPSGFASGFGPAAASTQARVMVMA